MASTRTGAEPRAVGLGFCERIQLPRPCCDAQRTFPMSGTGYYVEDGALGLQGTYRFVDP